MKNKLIFIFLFMPPIFTLAQQYGIKTLGMEQGISNNYVVSIAQDKKGFIWFATESGLNRFDGNSFKIYKKKNGTPNNNSISGNELNKVYADKFDDIVWIATQREGLNAFDCKSETFKHYKYDPSNNKSLVTNDITDITNSPNGNLWISTYHKGVEYFDKKTQTFVHYNKTTVPEMVNENLWAVKEDNKGLLYMGHVWSGLSVLSLKDKTIKNFRHDPNNKESLPGDEVRVIYIDKNDNIWVGTNNGLALFNAEKESFTVFKHDPLNKNSLLANYVFTINQLNDGRLWIGTENGGVSILDFQQSMFSSPQHISFTNITYSDDGKGLSNQTIRSIHQDTFNNIWLATYGGGVNFTSSHPPYFNTWTYSPIPKLKNSLNNKVAWGICADKQDQLWIGTDGGGINLFADGERTKIIEKGINSITDNAILAATKDSENNLWFGTFNGGVNIYNSQYGLISKLQLDDKSTDIRCFYEDGKKNMWIGSNNGVYTYNLITKIKKGYSRENSDLPNNLVRAISKDNKDRLWIGFFGEGLAILDENMKMVKTFKTDSGFPSNTVDHIYRDKKGRMWIATGEGLVCFNSLDKEDQYIVYDNNSGLINSHIRAITEDSQGNIWISTNGGISRFISDQNKFFNYNHHDGIPLGDFMSGSVTKNSKGIIFFGSQNGVCYFDPEKIPMNISLPPTIITEFKFYNNKISSTNDEINIPLIANSVNLDYNQNTFKVSFNALDYSLNHLIDYTYMLKGLEDIWYTTQGENSVTFRNVPPGSYELLIKSRVKNQEWAEEITSLKIMVNPPLWLTWWAKSFYTVAILLIVFLGFRFYKRKLDLENSLTLEKRNHSQEQELHNERLRFFTNIAHELRTPLTLILGPLEDLHSDPTLAEKHSSKISVIHRSATRLLSLINQILEFRKTETQNKKLCVYKTNLAQLIEEVGLKYKELNLNNHISFNIVIETENVVLYFDPDIITTILDNLISNAFKYTRKGNITLKLRDIQKQGINYTEIEINDTGIGIPTESLPKIFDRYYQAERDILVSGTGIGLALVQNLISIHQGYIDVDSKQGEGTIFRFGIISDNTYPSALHADSEPKHLIESIDNYENLKSGDTKQIILVIEDNEDIREYISSSLSEQYKIYTAENGRKGLEAAFTRIPDIIISDIMMPEMDGLELSKNLKEDVRTSHIPIILLTAKDTIQDRTDGYNIGVESYITKPFSANLLQSRITNLLESRKKIAELINRNTVNKNAIIIDSLSKLDNEFIAKVTSIIEQNLDSDKIDVAFIADKMNMSHSTLYRKVKALAGMTTNEFIRKVRIRNAEQFLLTGKYTISEISYMVGINSITYFRQCFKDEYGLAPSEYLKQIINNANNL
ncbi:response regulator [Dysgonomonas sp. Marseille-P4677]|uniref:hybrid sensor histidine kinase/response regulator transcription factor n=1 Tax=Dysgonomonas sp. Marseille-P4677 TaxID=2364790 RepID=UPI0019120597|nr:hybrid sensor histidine kinase/response regulator transcription factor [Dysgonomonas sp. Marseille-P4677]MBK5719341.1 response regulator [Dysgonomonas sp. Marseille-P4677]